MGYRVVMKEKQSRSVEQDAKTLGISETDVDWLMVNGHLRAEWTNRDVHKARKQIHAALYERDVKTAQNYLTLPGFVDEKKLESIHLDYEQTLLTYRKLADIRFKLLAFIPAISGIAITLLSRDVNTLFYHPQIALVIALFGFVVTLGLTIYDQRNSQIHDAAVGRAKFLEDVLEFPSRKGSRGHTNQRPGDPRRLLKVARIWHDRGLALIYGAVLGAWWFPIWYALLVLWETFPHYFFGLSSPHTTLGLSKPSIAGVLTALTALLFISEFHRLEGRPREQRTRKGSSRGKQAQAKRGSD